MAVKTRERYCFDNINKSYLDGVGWETIQYMGFMDGLSATAESADKETINAVSDMFAMYFDTKYGDPSYNIQRMLTSANIMRELVDYMRVKNTLENKTMDLYNKKGEVKLIDEIELERKFERISEKRKNIRELRKARKEELEMMNKLENPVLEPANMKHSHMMTM
ncbi:MAG: hypothetical protein K6A23_13310 [Butyrivibrio sp.]|nr:hypothetical protein [Butyrivibrio sp.]